MISLDLILDLPILDTFWLYLASGKLAYKEVLL